MTECPRTWCAPWVQVLRLARLAARGSWPAAGGTLDQTAWFHDAVAFVESEDIRWRASTA